MASEYLCSPVSHDQRAVQISTGDRQAPNQVGATGNVVRASISSNQRSRKLQGSAPCVES
jgi:hypothetical protein